MTELECVHEKFVPDFIFTSITSGYPEESAQELLDALQSKFPGSEYLLTGRFFLENGREYPSSFRLIRNPGDLRAVFE